MKVNRKFNPNCYMGHLNSINEIEYCISEQDYIMDQNVVLVLDTSASMELVWLNEKEKRIEVLIDCVKRLLENFHALGAKVSIFACSENGKYLDIHTSCGGINTEDYVSKVIRLNVGGNTNLGDGLREAYWYLNNDLTALKKYIIILSDGETNSYTTVGNTAQSNFKLDEGDSIYTFKGTRAIEYAQKVADMIAGEQVISTYAAALTANTPNQLEAISAACNALPLENGKHYYQIRFAEEIQAIYSKIKNSLPNSIPVTLTFNEVFPYGVEVLNVPEGLIISKQADNRYCVKGTIDTLFIKNDITGKYNFKPWEGAIKVKYTLNGLKLFFGPNVSYSSPSGEFIVAELDAPLMYSVFY